MSKVAKAIEQEHNGYLFRSRLEAKWSEFFKQINLSTHYEYQGYDLGNGTWYLPDFYIPKWKCYFEAKNPSLVEDNSKCNELKMVGRKAYLLKQQTNYKVITCFGGFESESGGGHMMAIHFPGLNINTYRGDGVYGYGTFGTCKGMDVLYLRALEPEPAVIAFSWVIRGYGNELTRDQWEKFFTDPRDIVEAAIKAISFDKLEQMERDAIEVSGGDRLYREYLIPLHSSVGFNFAVIKDSIQGCKIFAPFSDPLLCNFNASYFDKFKPYTEAYRIARQLRFEHRNGRKEKPEELNQ